MIKLMKVTIITGVLTLGVAALAMASGKPETVPPENTHATSTPNYAPEPTGGPTNELPPQAKAYGRVCKEQEASKEHVAGEKGTPFSNCVVNMAQAHKHQNMAAGRVCKDQTKKHAKGEVSPFRSCVKGVLQLRREEREHKS